METNQPRPKNYLVESILALIFCCLPLGIVAIIHASKVNSEYDQGNYEAAQKASAEAKKWMIYSIIGYFVALIVSVILVFVFGIGTALLGLGSEY